MYKLSKISDNIKCYNDFLLNNEYSLIYHTNHYNKMLSAIIPNCINHILIVSYEDEIVGALPLMLKINKKYGNILNSLPFFGSIGGFVGTELKRTGFDGIVITGRAPKPVYLWIHDEEAEICDAASLWGRNAYNTGEILQDTHGEKSQYITTGVAGENKVRTAVMVGPHFSAASAGFGAVMGAKNLKALVFRGSIKPSVADRDRLKELNRYTIKISKGLNLSSPPQVALASHSLERIRRS